MNCNNHVTETLGAGEHTADQSVSERVVRAVAAREERDAIDLDPPLYNAINPEALDVLFDGRDVEGSITFDWRGYRIVVSSNGSVQLTEEKTC